MILIQRSAPEAVMLLRGDINRGIPNQYVLYRSIDNIVYQCTFIDGKILAPIGPLLAMTADKSKALRASGNQLLEVIRREYREARAEKKRGESAAV